MPVKTKPREVLWSDIYIQLQEDKIEFFLNTQLEPMVMIPNDGFQTEWLVNSQRFRDLLMSMYFELSNGGILKSSERDFLMAQIREESRRGGRRLTEPEAVEADEDVIVQAVLFLVTSLSKTTETTVFNDRTVVLLQKLRNFQKDGSISYAEEMPIFTNIFSRRLTRLVSVLRGYGVQVDLSHVEEGSRCKLTRLDTFQYEPNVEQVALGADDGKVESSVQSSGGKAITGKQLQKTDGTDGETRLEEDDEAVGANDNPDVQVPEPTRTGAASGNATPAPTSAKKGGAK